MEASVQKTESFFARVMVRGSTIFGFDKIGSSEENGDICLKFTHNITEATKYESPDDSRKEKMLNYDPKIKMITILEELENGQMRMGRVVGEDKIKEFFSNIHIIEVEASITVKNLMRR